MENEPPPFTMFQHNWVWSMTAWRCQTCRAMEHLPRDTEPPSDGCTGFQPSVKL